MSKVFSKNLSIILVEPRQPGNIGATCRAMANYGVSDLRLVNPCNHLAPEAVKFAVAAKPLLGSAKLFADLPSTVADLHMSVALTRRSGRLRGELPQISQLPRQLHSLPAQSRVGLVFGREDCGLSTAEIACCTHAASIPTIGETGSLNLAQAVVVSLYELCGRSNQFDVLDSIGTGDVLPPQRDLDPLMQQLEQLADLIGYTNPSRPEVVGHTLRQLLGRARPNVREYNMLRGLVSQLEQSVQGWPGKRRG